MTKDEALKMALEALEQWNTPLYKRGTVITAIKEALAQQDAEAHLQAVADFGQEQEQEPVAWWDAKLGVFDEKHFDQLQPLYTSPPKRTWVGLTDDEYQQIQRDYFQVDQWRGIEAKLKAKNGY